MHPILSKLFAKKGITDVQELHIEERKTFEAWDKVLSKEELTINEVKEFCQAQINIIENKWSNFDLEQVKKAEMIPYHTVYRTLLSVMNSPRSAREQLEKYLNELITKI